MTDWGKDKRPFFGGPYPYEVTTVVYLPSGVSAESVDGGALESRGLALLGQIEGNRRLAGLPSMATHYTDADGTYFEYGFIMGKPFVRIWPQQASSSRLTPLVMAIWTTEDGYYKVGAGRAPADWRAQYDTYLGSGTRYLRSSAALVNDTGAELSDAIIGVDTIDSGGTVLASHVYMSGYAVTLAYLGVAAVHATPARKRVVAVDTDTDTLTLFRIVAPDDQPADHSVDLGALDSTYFETQAAFSPVGDEFVMRLKQRYTETRYGTPYTLHREGVLRVTETDSNTYSTSSHYQTVDGTITDVEWVFSTVGPDQIAEVDGTCSFVAPLGYGSLGEYTTTVTRLGTQTTFGFSGEADSRFLVDYNESVVTEVLGTSITSTETRAYDLDNPFFSLSSWSLTAETVVHLETVVAMEPVSGLVILRVSDYTVSAAGSSVAGNVTFTRVGTVALKAYQNGVLRSTLDVYALDDAYSTAMDHPGFYQFVSIPSVPHNHVLETAPAINDSVMLGEAATVFPFSINTPILYPGTTAVRINGSAVSSIYGYDLRRNEWNTAVADPPAAPAYAVTASDSIQGLHRVPAVRPSFI